MDFNANKPGAIFNKKNTQNNFETFIIRSHEMIM